MAKGYVPVQYCEQPTNGLVYFRAMCSLNTLPEDLRVYVPLFCSIITKWVPPIEHIEQGLGSEINAQGEDGNIRLLGQKITLLIEAITNNRMRSTTFLIGANRKQTHICTSGRCNIWLATAKTQKQIIPVHQGKSGSQSWRSWWSKATGAKPQLLKAAARLKSRVCMVNNQ